LENAPGDQINQPAIDEMEKGIDRVISERVVPKDQVFQFLTQGDERSGKAFWV
jgi:hypothetical protein